MEKQTKTIISLTLFESESFGGLKIHRGGYTGTIRANKVCEGIVIMNNTAQNLAELDISDIALRKLTPKECWRLMDFDDSDFDAAQKVNSNTQLYKQAGNSICVNCLCEIFKKMF